MASRSLPEHVAALLPVGDARFKLELEQPARLDERGALVAYLRLIVFTPDGAVQDVKVAEWCLASAADVAKPERVRAYLEAWTAALPEVVSRLHGDRIAELSLDDVVLGLLLDDAALVTRADFTAVLRDDERLRAVLAEQWKRNYPQPTIDESWDVIEVWLDAHAPPLAATLRQGAPDDVLEKFVAAAPFAPPASFVESWRRHDGQTGDLGLFHQGYRLLALAEITSIWGALRTRHVPKHPGWMPFAEAGPGLLLCLDLEASGDARGRVLRYAAEEPAVTELAGSLDETFATLNALLHDDVVEFDPHARALIQRR